MTNWKTLLNSMQRVKDKKHKRRAFIAVRKYLEKASVQELKGIIETTGDKFVRKHAKIQIWWREFDKEPKNLLELIKTSDNKEKINIAIEELGNLKYRDAINTLIGFLGDTELRDSSALALRKMPTQEAFEPLVQSIKQNSDGAECLLYALQVLDCSEAAELLVDLFIPAPNAPAVRDDIYVCFSEGAVKRIPKEVKETCCSKLLRATETPQSPTDTKELKQLYDLVNQTEEV